MRAIEINLFPSQEARGDDTDQFEETLECFLGALRSNNNLCGDWAALELEGKVQVRSMTPAPDALKRDTWTIYARGWHDKLNAMSHSPLQMCLVPEEKEGEHFCDCPTPSGLILFSTYPPFSMPIRCLDCDCMVPLYRLPFLNDEEEHWTLRQWNRESITLDELYMISQWGERMAYHQLSNPRSGFIKHSRQVAALLEAKTQTPVYVFLLNVHEPYGKGCPRCKRPWLWPDSGKSLHTFKCDHCRLISQEPVDVSDPNYLSKMHP